MSDINYYRLYRHVVFVSETTTKEKKCTTFTPPCFMHRRKKTRVFLFFLAWKLIDNSNAIVHVKHKRFANWFLSFGLFLFCLCDCAATAAAAVIVVVVSPLYRISFQTNVMDAALVDCSVDLNVKRSKKTYARMRYLPFINTVCTQQQQKQQKNMLYVALFAQCFR